MITEQLLRRLKVDAGLWLGPLSEACDAFEIDNEDRVACFLANCLHESAGFTRLVESMNYSPQRLLAVFPKYFTPEEAVEFAHDEVRIAERVYGGRMGNGAEGIGDGFRYRGRGLLQLTGASMYRKAAIFNGPPYDEQPDLVGKPKDAARTAAWVWAEEKRCNQLADEGRFMSVVLRINGGTNGMDDRLRWLDKVRVAINGH
jgi:putative chitinase